MIGGDFNSASKRSLAGLDQTLHGYGFERLTTAHPTFGRFGRPFALDHIYGRHLRATDTGVTVAAVVSDHRPVWVDGEPT